MIQSPARLSAYHAGDAFINYSGHKRAATQLMGLHPPLMAPLCVLLLYFGVVSLADWLQIKTEYVTTKTSYAKLAKKYGVSTSAIKRKAVAEKWANERTKTEPKVYQKTVQKTASKIAAKVSSQIAVETVTKDRVIEELARVAFANGTDFATVGDFGDVHLTPTREIPVDKRAALAGIKEGKAGTEIKTYDKIKALELLGKHLGMFDNKQDEAGRDALERLDKLIEGIDDAAKS